RHHLPPLLVLDPGEGPIIAERAVEAELGKGVFRSQPALCAVELRIDAGEGTDRVAADRGREQAARGFDDPMPLVAPIAGKELVAPVARQRHRYVPAGELADLLGRH